MALTKVTGQVIKNTTDVTVGVLTVTNTLAVGGTVSIGGTLTYEDVTNVDAVGLITARNGIVVGSGITLSKDGDIFATGITTVSGNVKVGTGITLSPDGDGFFTGVITATSYSGIDLSDVTGATGDFSIADKIVHTGDTDTAIRFPSANTVTVEAAGVQKLSLSTGEVVFNDTGADCDFRIEGDTNANLVKVDAGNDRVGVGLAAPQQAFHVYHASDNGLALFESGDANCRIDLKDNSGQVSLEAVGDNLLFGTSSSNTERMRVTSTGNVEIDSFSSPSTRTLSLRTGYLSNANGGVGLAAKDHSGSAADGLGVYGTDGVSIHTANAGTVYERLRITTDGSILIGNSNGGSEAINMVGGGGGILISRSASGVPNDGQTLGDIGLNSYSSSQTCSSADVLIRGQADGDHSGSSAGSALLLFTKPASTGPGSAPTERFRINKSGAIGLAGANYGTSGQVLTSQGSGSAVQWATPASATSGTYTSVGTGYYKDITTTSTNVIRYDIMFTGVSIGGGMDWQFQLGDSGGVEGSGYEVVASYRSHNSSNNTNNRSDAFRWHGTGSGSFIMDGRFSLIRIHNNKWFGEGLLVRTEAGSTIYDMVGTKELSGALTTIRISSSYDDSEVFDGGHYKVIEHTGTV